MSKSLTTIVGLGLVTAIFMALMSMFYLQHVPNKADLAQLEGDLRTQFGMVLDTVAPMQMELLQPEHEGRRMGVRVVCTLRPDLRQRRRSVGLYLERMVQYIEKHPDWRGKVDLIMVAHTAPMKMVRSHRAPDRAPKS